MLLPSARLVFEGSRHLKLSQPPIGIHGAVTAISVIHNDALF
jgi:hypothetical protein